MAMLPNPLPRLADDPTGATLGLRLPPGRLLDTTSDGPWHEPLLWYADGTAAPDTWSGLLAARSAGLLPVLLESEQIRDVPFAEWTLDPGMMSYPGDHDAEEYLAESWAYATEDEGWEEGERQDLEKLLAPYGFEWPGLAPRLVPGAGEDGVASGSADADSVAAEVTAELVGSGGLDNPRAALVHARRSADVPAAMGWTGPTNHEHDVAVLCAVLRSWEDRFGLRVVALGPDTLTATVAAPPRTPEEAEAVAAEHFAFCPDNITQGHYDTLREYAHKALLAKHTWYFWWD
jgi:hypothetical protein